MTDARIVTHDIFGKAAREYCGRIGKNPTELYTGFLTYEERYREELAALAEKINALKSVGAI